MTPAMASFRVASGGNLTLTGVGDGQLDYALPGSGGLIKSGTGTWILSGPNTYTGGTTIDAGVLQLTTNGGRVGSLAIQGPLTVSGGTLDLNGISQSIGALAGTGGVITATSAAALSSVSSTNTTFSGALVVRVSLTVSGGGLTLGGPNSHTGGSSFYNVAVALLPTGSLGPGLTSLNDASTLDVSAFPGGYPLSQGTLATDSSGANVTGSLVVGPATLAPLGAMTVSRSLSLDGATYSFTPNDPISSNVLSLSGTNYIEPTTVLNMGRAYEVFGYSGSAPVTTGLQLTGQFASGRQQYSFAASGGSVDVRVTSGSVGNLTWRGTIASQNWDVQASSNWLNANTSAADVFYDADAVAFNDTAGTAGSTVSIVGTVQPGSITVGSNAVNYTFGGTGSIGGGTGLTMSGASTLTIATNNSYTGGTTLANGVVNANSAYALGVGPVGVSSGTLNLTAGTSSGTGPITVTGGVVNASAPLTPSSVTLSGGRINVNDPGALGSGLLTINGGTLGNTSGGSVVSATNNRQQWNGNFTFAGPNPLDLGNGLIVLNNTVTVTVSGSTLSAEGGVSVPSGANLNLAGSGTLSLDGMVNNNGLVNIVGATLNIGPDGQLYPASHGAGAISVTGGGVLRVTGNIAWGNSLGYVNYNPPGLTIDGGSLVHYGNSDDQTAGGAGRVMTIGPNGATFVSETPYQTFSIGFWPGLNIVNNNGGLITLTGDGDGNFNFDIPGSGGLVKSGAGTWILSADSNTYPTDSNTYSGGTTINAGVLLLSASNALGPGGLTAGGGTLDMGGFNATVSGLTGAAGVIASSYGPATLTVGTSSSTVFSGTIVDGEGPVSLVVAGGTLTLEGANTYTGGTTVLDGTLVLADREAIQEGTSLIVGSDAASIFGQSIPAAAPRFSAAAAPVPEPGTLALLLAGVLAGALARRRIPRLCRKSTVRL